MSSSNYADFVLEQLVAIRGTTTARFFGGVGLSIAGTQFGFIMSSALYFVVDDRTRPKYELMGSKCFSYDTQKKRVAVRKYYEVPAGLLEDSEQLIELAKESIAVAVELKSATRTLGTAVHPKAKHKHRRRASKPTKPSELIKLARRTTKKKVRNSSKR